MHEQFFTFMGLREDPFHVSPDPRFYYPTRAHESALTELLHGIETRQGFLVLTGEAGTGKTSLLNQIIDWLHRRRRSTAYIFHAHLKPIGLLRFILSDFGVPCQSKSKSALVRALYTWLVERHSAHDLPVLILDEAQALPLDTLDELRLLLNLETPRGKLLQIILSGQPELDDKLRLPALRQLRQRIMSHSRLTLLSQKETGAYIFSRLAAAGCSDSSLFPDQAVEDIYASSRGIPRVVNLLCEHALMSAYAEQQRVVSSEIVQRIAMNFDLLAKPLADDTNLQPHPGRPAPFPFIEKPAPAPVSIPRLAASSWTQIDFDIFNEPQATAESESAPAVREHPVPPVPSAAQPESPKLATRPADSPASRRAGKIVRYWRKHRSPSLVAALVRNSVASVRGGWQAFIHEPQAAAHPESAPAVREHPLPPVPSAAQPESPKFATRPADSPASDRAGKIVRYWRKHRSTSAVAALVRNSMASIRGCWQAFIHLFTCYLRSVVHSFVRDCRGFFRGLTPPTPALQFSSSSNSANHKPAMHQSVLAPMVNWLRRPITPRHISRHRSRTGSLHRK